MRAEWYPSPIKINRFLHVTGKRADGYHLLQTIFQFIDYGDEIGFETNTNGKLTRVDEHEFALPEFDLCLKAAESMRQLAGQPELGAAIYLKKRIPPGTGLGAGSSNAASTLLALNDLWNLRLSRETLLQLASDLGADVPVFVHGKSVWAEGVGNLFKDCTPDTGLYCIVIPDDRVSTAEAFCHPELICSHQPVDYDDFLSGATGNDLERPVCTQHPRVREALEYLQQFGPARMSGTGSAVFVALENADAGERILSELPTGSIGFTALAANVSLCHRAL